MSEYTKNALRVRYARIITALKHLKHVLTF